MKHTLSLLVIICCFASTAAAQKDLEYQRVVDVQASADQIYAAERQRLAEEMVSSQDVIQVDDRDNGVITGNFILTMPIGFRISRNIKVRFTSTIEARDGRFRYTAKNFVGVVHVQGQGISYLDDMHERIVGRIPAFMDEYTNEIRDYINAWAAEPLDDW